MPGHLNDFALHSKFVKRATRKFMPGERAEDGLAAGAAIAATGRGILFTQLGEAITSAEGAIAVRDHYLWLFDQIRATAANLHHPGAVRLRDEAVLCVEKEAPHRERLAEICEDAAHASIVGLAWINVTVRRSG